MPESMCTIFVSQICLLAGRSLQSRSKRVHHIFVLYSQIQNACLIPQPERMQRDTIKTVVECEKKFPKMLSVDANGNSRRKTPLGNLEISAAIFPSREREGETSMCEWERERMLSRTQYDFRTVSFLLTDDDKTRGKIFVVEDTRRRREKRREIISYLKQKWESRKKRAGSIRNHICLFLCTAAAAAGSLLPPLSTIEIFDCTSLPSFWLPTKKKNVSD